MHDQRGSYFGTKLKRRQFLEVVGGLGLAAAAGAGAGWYARDYMEDRPEEPEEEDEVEAPTVDRQVDVQENYLQGDWLPTGCAGCTSWCSVQVNVVQGRAVKVRGNPHSKVNGKNSCPRSHLALQQVYDPDRIKVPMRRTNPNKGKDEPPEFVPISWDEAMEEIAEKIMDLRARREPHKLVVWRGRYTRLRKILHGVLPQLIGSPNTISHSSICAEAEKFGSYYTEGYWDYRDYDIEHTQYALIWGADPISSNRQISYYLSRWGDLLERAQVAVVDPRLSRSANKADEWLPVTPGEDGALAMAMAHVILTEGLWNRDFVGDFVDGQNRFVAGAEVDEDLFEENHTHGLVRWWNLELKDRTPEWGAARSGIPEAQIRKVAGDFGRAGPNALCFMGGGPVMQVRGAYNSMAIHALNGLVGSVDNRGGVVRGSSAPRQQLPDPGEYIDSIAEEGLAQPMIDQRGTVAFPALKDGVSGGGVVTNRSADAIIDEDPYDIQVAIGYWNNFSFASPETSRWDEALSKIPFFVHIVTHESEMSRYADILLPSTHHMFEQYGMLYQKGNLHTHFWLSRPVIDRLWDTREPEAEFSWLLAEKLAEKGFPNVLNYFRKIRDPETGSEPTDYHSFAEYATKHIMQPIWDPAQHQSGDRFSGWEEFKTIGVWNSEQYRYRTLWGNFGTKTGKFEFYSETLKDALSDHAARHDRSVDEILQTCKYQARGEMAFVPHYEEPYRTGPSADYPFLLVDHKSGLNREGRSANCTWYYEVKDADPGDEAWRDVARLNPRDATALGIQDGDSIILSSPIGQIRCTAKLWEGTPPGTVGKTYGQGHWAYGRVAAEDFAQGRPRGGNANDIIPADYDRLSGSSSFYAHTRVRVSKG